MRSPASIPLLALAVLAAALGGCGDDDEAAPTTTVLISPEPTGPTSTGQTTDAEAEPDADADAPPEPDKPSGPAETANEDPRSTELERAAARTVRGYVAALDARDGERVCALLAPGAIDQVELPVEKGDCASSVTASIGYRDPRGLPVWGEGQVSRLRSVEIEADAAKVVATVVTRFADRGGLSVEDDVVYLSRSGDGWLIAKPSSTLYRAVGIADVPPSVLAPPG